MTEQLQTDVPEVVEVKQDIVEEPIVPESNYFAELASMDVKRYIEKKNGFSYLSWAHAVEQLKRKHPTAQIITKRFPEGENGNMVPYLVTAAGVFVEVEVIVDGISVSEPFPVLDFRNKPIAKPTSFDINNSIQRAKVKAIAGHGLGLYVYAGEDMPVEEGATDTKQPPAHVASATNQNFKKIVEATDQQKNSIREKATQIASLTLGNNATPDQTKALIKNIYTQHQIVQNMTEEQASGKIVELSNVLKTIHDQRMKSQQVAQQATQANPNADLFAPPAS